VRPIICVDISHYSFEEFVEFVFDRDVPPKSEMPTSDEGFHRWYYCANPVFDLDRQCSHYVRLFSEPTRLLGMFSKAQLEQGFSATLSGRSFSAGMLIWNTDLPFEQRKLIVKSMFYLFRDLFRVERVGTAYTWWPRLCYGWENGQRQRSRGGEDLTMQDVMFETMSEVLSIESDRCRWAALQGLRLLHHPATLELFQKDSTVVPCLEGRFRESLEEGFRKYPAEDAAWAKRISARRSR
jgi:hypothetical protein